MILTLKSYLSVQIAPKITQNLYTNLGSKKHLFGIILVSPIVFCYFAEFFEVRKNVPRSNRRL